MNRRLAIAAAALAAFSARAQSPTVAGEVVKIDRKAGRVTIKHGGIKHLDMPAMTISFRVRDPKMLDEVAEGDRVRFTVERTEGQYTILMLGKAPE